MVANQACHSRAICRISDALSTTPAVTSVPAASTSAATCRHSPDAGRLLLPSRTTKDQQAQNHCFRVGRRRRGGGFRRDPHRNRRRGHQHGLHGTDLQGHTHHQPGRPADLQRRKRLRQRHLAHRRRDRRGVHHPLLHRSRQRRSPLPAPGRPPRDRVAPEARLRASRGHRTDEVRHPTPPGRRDFEPAHLRRGRRLQ